MDRLSFLGQPNDEVEVDALLSQLSDEHLMKLKVNSHSKFNKNPSVALASEKWSNTDDDEVLDSELSNRLANLKATPLKQSSAAARSKAKQTEDRKDNIGGLSLRRSSSRRKDGKVEGGGGGSDKRRLSRGKSQNSKKEFLSTGGENLDDSEDIDANLMARFLALKETSSPSSCDNSMSQSSGNLSSSKGESNTYHNSSSYGSSSPSATLLGGSSARSSPRVMTTSVTTSCHCSTPSPLKLLKQLSSKKILSKPASQPSSPSSDSSPAGSGKSAGKESSSKKKSQHKNRESEAENLSSVKDMKRLLSSVADRVGLDRNRVSSADEDHCLSGDGRAFSLLDREQEYLKVSSEEDKLNREVDRVVEWAKDAARLGLDTSDGEDEDLELGEDALDSDSSTVKPVKTAKDMKKVTKPTKKKKWGLF